MTQPAPTPPAATRPLYHDSGVILEFGAKVVAVSGLEVALDATAFYPEGGGQASDTGVLKWANTDTASQVTAARKDKATGVIWHLLGGEVPAIGTAVQGQVDEKMRWRHMQRHSAEHLLAQAFKRINPAFEVASVSMTSPQCTLDFYGDPTAADVQAAEELLRGTLGRQDLVLETPVVPEAELPNYPLRRESKVRGQVRLVIFKDAGGVPFDVSACGGTHVPRASLCSPVVVLRTERIKGGQTRVVFMAGEEATAYLSGVYRNSRALAQGFSVPVEKLTERVEALTAERDALKTDGAHLRTQLAQKLIREVQATDIGGIPTRSVTVPDDALLLPVLSQVPPSEVLLAVTPGGRCGVACAHQSVHAGELLRATLHTTGGKGGGKPDLAQGNTAQPEVFLNAAQQRLQQGKQAND